VAAAERCWGGVRGNIKVDAQQNAKAQTDGSLGHILEKPEEALELNSQFIVPEPLGTLKHLQQNIRTWG
jgi:hypothetical protein